MVGSKNQSPRKGKVNLTTYVRQRGGVMENPVILENVDLPGGALPPHNGITTFFGTQAMISSMRPIMDDAILAGDRIIPVTLELNVTRPTSMTQSTLRATLDDLHQRNMLDLNHVAQDLRLYIEDQLGPQVYTAQGRFMTTQPSVLERLILRNPLFRTIGCVAYSVISHGNQLEARVATVFDRAMITGVRVAARGLEVHLPELAGPPREEPEPSLANVASIAPATANRRQA